jgi:hypothetical protein
MANDARHADPGGSTTAFLDPVDGGREGASIAYGNLARHVEDLARVVLHDTEAAVLRDAADACLFDDDDAVERVAMACELLARLSEFGRIEPTVVARLSEELVAVDCESRRLLAATS